MARLDVRQHSVHLLCIDQRAHRGFRVQRVAWLPAFKGFNHQRQEGVFDRTLDQQAGTCGADFTLIEGDRAGGRFGGCFKVWRVGEDDVRAFTTRLQPDAFHVRFTGVNHQLLGNFGRAGEHQRVDIHVQGQRFADGVTVTGQNVKNACGNTCLNSQCSNADGRQWRFFRRFEDHRVTGGQRRPQFPARHHQREVPRHNGADHANGFTGHQTQLVMGGGGHFIVNFVDGFTAPAQCTGGAGYVDVQRIANWLAHVQGFKKRQLLGVLLEQIGKTNHHRFTLGRCQPRPDA